MRFIPRAVEADTHPKRERGTQHISSFTLRVSVPMYQPRPREVYLRLSEGLEIHAGRMKSLVFIPQG